MASVSHKVGGRSDARYYFFSCDLTLAKEPLSAEERARTGGKKKVVVREVIEPFAISSITRAIAPLERERVEVLHASRYDS